jgi:hypothetical protein
MTGLQYDPDEIDRAMTRLRRSLEKRLASDGKPGRTARTGGDLSDYDWKGLWARIAPKVEWDGRGWRAVAAEIGITAADLSRIKAGQPVAANKVLAICAWADLDPWRWFRPAKGAKRLSASRRKKSASRRASAAGAACASGGAGDTPGVRSDARPDGGVSREEH